MLICVEELADVERLKRIFYCYFTEHESCSGINNAELQLIADERAYACAIKYREKIRRLHLSHADYYLDTIPRLSEADSELQEQIAKSLASARLSQTKMSMDCSMSDEHEYPLLSVSVV